MLSIIDRVLEPRVIEATYPEIRIKNLKRIISVIESLNESLHYDDLELEVHPEVLKHAYYELWALEALTEG